MTNLLTSVVLHPFVNLYCLFEPVLPYQWQLQNYIGTRVVSSPNHPMLRTGLLVYNRSLLISCHQALSTLAQLIVTVYSTKTLTNTWEISGRPRCVLVGTYGIKLQIWLMCALWHGVVYAGVGSGTLQAVYSGIRADSRFASTLWETALLCNDVSHWLGASLETALQWHHSFNTQLMSREWNSMSLPPKKE